MRKAYRTRRLESVQETVYHIFKMVDRQFTHQNGVSVAVLPTPSPTPTPEPKWITPEEQKNDLQTKVQLEDNMTTMERVILCLSEIGGTAILVFLGCMGCSKGIVGNDIPHEQVSLTFGLAIMIAAQIFGHLSGCHINPIVTIAAATLGNIPIIQVPIFIIGQILGGLAGFGLVRAVTPNAFIKPPNDTVSLCSPDFHSSLTPIQALLVEFILSLILVWVCCGVWDSRNTNNTDSIPIRLGLTVAGLALAGGPYSGANMNPARSFAPALINGDWNNHWIYWIGPMSAGFFGALFYRFVFAKEAQTEELARVTDDKI